MTDYLDRIKALGPFERLLHWCRERESIRLKKDGGEPAPWTADPILRAYRFTNVRRMDDRVSRWLLDNWYAPYRDHPNVLWAVALARFVNLPAVLGQTVNVLFSSGDFYGGKPNWEAVVKILKACRKYGPVFNAAYIVRGGGLGSDKVEETVRTVSALSPREILGADVSGRRYMEPVHAALQRCYGFGSFMAGQVVADLRWAVTGDWADRHVWAPLGPGSKKGLNRVLGLAPDTPMPPALFQEEFGRFRERLMTRLPPKVSNRLEAMDVQNCCCEFDKFERALWGQGTPKQLYRGGG